MKLSTRSTYGMRALVELGLARGRGPLSAAQIARRQGLSVAYLEQLLHRLKKQGIVTSVRGPKGGYLLAREPEQLPVGEIVRTLDGETALQPPKTKDGHRYAHRVAQAVFRCVHERLAASLETVTLHEVCEEVHALSGEPLDHRYVFHI